MRTVFTFSFLISLLVMITSCGQQARQELTDDKNQGIIIVASKSGDDVYMIDRSSGDILAILPTGLEPHEVEVSDNGLIAVVCNYGDRENPGNTLSVYDLKALELKRTIDLGQHTRPHGMQWITGTDHMLVTAEGSRNLLVVDVVNGEIVKEMYTGEDVSHMVAATPDFKRAFVPSIRTGNVAVFELETGDLITHIYSGRGAEGIDVSPDGKEVWVTNRSDNTITIFDTQSLEVIAQLPCSDFPIRAKFTPDGSKFLVSNARSGTISVFDALKKELIADIKLTPPVPADTDEERYFAEFEGTSIPIGLVVPDNKTAYVANTRSDAVSIIDLDKLEIKGHFPAGKEPDGINFSPIRPEI